jgi:RNA polymerase sigma-70 factor (ECF subfamily)
MSLYSAHTDEQLLQCVRDGDEPAFDELYRRYWIPLYDAAYKRLDDRQQAEDIIQDVFIRLWIRKQDLAIDNVAAYLHTAVRYNVLSYFTRHKATSSFCAPFEIMLTESETPEERFMAKELLELVYAYAETLSERKRQIFLLHIKSRLSTKEISEVLSITQKSVQNQLGSVLHGLRKSLIPVILAIIAARF